MKKNLDLPSDLLLSTDQRNLVRANVLAQAEQYTRSLLQVAGQHLERTDHKDCTLICAGHQPIIYHMGILEKLRAIQQFRTQTSSSQTLVALNVTIDIDEGSISDIPYPISGSSPTITTAQLIDDNRIGFLQGNLTAQQVQTTAGQVLTSLEQLGIATTIVQQAFSLYSEYAHLPLRDLNTLVRLLLCGKEVLELPFSLLLAEQTIQSFFYTVILDADRFHDEYNRLLDLHREERKIKNRANPFPNLREQDGAKELPFWIYNRKSDRRDSLYIRSEGDELVLSDGKETLIQLSKTELATELSQHFLIYPKAVFTSIILRYFVSDLFIHGLGGEHYDKFTDKLLTEYFGVPVKEYAIVSSTYSLFPEQLHRYEREQEQIRQIQEATNNPEQFFDTGLFDQETQEQLLQLQTDKQALIEQLKSSQDKQALQATKQQLSKIREDIKTIILRYMTPKEPISKEQYGVYRYRQFPYFFFTESIGCLK